MTSTHIPRSLATALARHECDVLAETDDGRLATAILAHATDRLDDGLSVASVRGMISYPGAALLRLTPPGCLLADLDLDGTRRLVADALAAGYTPQTIKGKHLQLLRALFHRAQVPDVVGEVKRRMRSALAHRYTPPPAFTAEEFAAMFRRIQEHPGKLRTRRRDLAVIRLLALRAIRTGELARVRIERDIHLSVPCIDISQPKVRAYPRRIELSAELAADARQLVGHRTSGPLVEGGERRVNAILETWKHRLGEPRLNQRHLRRSCATDLSAQGAPLPVIRDVLGHVHGSPQTPRYLLGDAERVRSELRRFEHQTRPYPTVDSTESTPPWPQRA